MTGGGRGCGAHTGNGHCGAPARLYPAGWRCPGHSPARLAGRDEPPAETSRPARMRSSAPASCRFCGTISYKSDEHGPAHECCRAWRAVIAAGYPCPACQLAAFIARQPKLNPDGSIRQAYLPALPPLPTVLPDGRPYVPGLLSGDGHPAAQQDRARGGDPGPGPGQDHPRRAQAAGSLARSARPGRADMTTQASRGRLGCIPGCPKAVSTYPHGAWCPRHARMMAPHSQWQELGVPYPEGQEPPPLPEPPELDHPVTAWLGWFTAVYAECLNQCGRPACCLPGQPIPPCLTCETARQFFATGQSCPPDRESGSCSCPC